MVSVEGRWGSGKTSLINLILHYLELESPSEAKAIWFSPWLIGDRNALIRTVLDQLAETVAEIELERGDATKDTLLRVQNFRKSLAEFVERLRPIEGAATVGSAMGDPHSLAIKTGLQGIKALKPSSMRLQSLKAKIDKQLVTLNHRIVVIIDDLDRLSPSEITEVFRLVSAVAGFTNVIYVLSFDRPVVAHAVQECLRLSDGDDYLQKIVQLAIHVPAPEPFVLRRVFLAKVQEILKIMDPIKADRLYRVVDIWGGRYLQTPRTLFRVIDELRFHIAGESK